MGSLSLAPLVNGLNFRARSDAKKDLRTLREILDVRIALDLSVADTLAAIYKGATVTALAELVEAMTAKALAASCSSKRIVRSTINYCSQWATP